MSSLFLQLLIEMGVRERLFDEPVAESAGDRFRSRMHVQFFINRPQLKVHGVRADFLRNFSGILLNNGSAGQLLVRVGSFRADPDRNARLRSGEASAVLA